MTKRTPAGEATDAVPTASPLRIDWERMDPDEPHPDLERVARVVARIVDRVRAKREADAAEDAA